MLGGHLPRYCFLSRLPEVKTLTTDVLLSDQYHHRENMDCTKGCKWVQVKLAAFAGEVGSHPGCSKATEEPGLCLCQEAREGSIHFGLDTQSRGPCCKGAAKGESKGQGQEVAQAAEG